MVCRGGCNDRSRPQLQNQHKVSFRQEALLLRRSARECVYTCYNLLDSVAIVTGCSLTLLAFLFSPTLFFPAPINPPYLNFFCLFTLCIFVIFLLPFLPLSLLICLNRSNFFFVFVPHSLHPFPTRLSSFLFLWWTLCKTCLYDFFAVCVCETLLGRVSDHAAACAHRSERISKLQLFRWEEQE